MGILLSRSASNAPRISKSPSRSSRRNTITSLPQKRELLNSKNIVVLVYSNTCPPCQRFKPLFEKFIASNKNKYAEKCSFYKESVTLEFTPEVRYLPSLVFYKKGRSTPVRVEVASTIPNLQKLIHKVYST